MLVATSGDPLEGSRQLVAVAAFLVFASGCVTNHPFVRGAELDVSGLVSELSATGSALLESGTGDAPGGSSRRSANTSAGSSRAAIAFSIVTAM